MDKNNTKLTTGLAIVCAILVMLLVFSLFSNTGVPIVNNSRLQELENENQRLQGDINNLQNENQRLQGTINNLQNENQRLQGTIKELQDITNLAKSRSIVEKYTINQQAGHYSRWTVDVQYAGYIFVRIDSSTTNLAFARVSYTSNGGQSPHTITYEHRSNNLSSGNYVCFPVLPGTVFVDVGNSNAINGATHTVTIEYWY